MINLGIEKTLISHSAGKEISLGVEDVSSKLSMNVHATTSLAHMLGYRVIAVLSNNTLEESLGALLNTG